MKVLKSTLVLLAILFLLPYSAIAQENIAFGKKANQSSTDYGGSASRAVDGVMNGQWGKGSVTHTRDEDGAWWQVDLGAVYNITKIRLWNRTDCCQERLKNFTVLVSEIEFKANTGGSAFASDIPAKADPTDPVHTFTGNSSGRYVRVFINGIGTLSLAEVEVFGTKPNVALNKPILTNQTICLKAVNGKYVSANNPGQTLIANKDVVSDYEKFRVVDAGNGKLALLCIANNNYICADATKNHVVVADRANLGEWETLDLKVNDNETLTIKAYQGKYVAAENGGNNHLVANRANPAEWETFTFEIKTMNKKHSEMSSQEYSDFVAKNAEHIHFVDDKMVEIKNEHVKKMDRFQFACDSVNMSLERLYNDNNEVHFLSYTQSQGNASFSTTHYFFWEGKLIYQFYHHTVEEGTMYVVDDHKTFFKDGEMIKCLERRYSHKKNESEPYDIPYELVDLNPTNKLTKDLEKLLTLSEEEIKTYLCK